MSSAEANKEKPKPERGEATTLPSVSRHGSMAKLGRVGPYHLLEVLGEGGFGIVYRAEQKQPVRRQVALKVIKPGMDSKLVVARFEAERQALALLDHPNIAQIFEGGTTEAGRPYFAMELVKGPSITEYCDKHNLDIDDRLELFEQVCEAVQHAHQKGIIHRDIKPSNILVPIRGDKPMPMIIDFGVSKAVSQPLTERTLFTEQGQFIGTPEYMSPEQAGTMIEDIDTRADIYSLGVVLYELLTGVLPFGRDELEKAGLAEIQKIIRETDPPHPSTRLSSLGEAATKIAKRRGTGVAALARRLHEELEWIPLKAMRKEPDRRYKTASELADDIRNYLKGDPLIAGPESMFYCTKKFVSRNRMLVTFVAVVLFALVAGIVASTILAIGQARARSEAERQAKIAQAVSEFLNNDLLGSVDPARARGQEVTVREVLDAASEKIEDQFKDEPLVEASIRMTLGGTYLGLGEYEKAEGMLQKALDIRRRVLGDVNADTLTSMNNLALLYVKQGRYDAAKPLHRKARDISKLLFGDEHPNTLISMNNLAALFERQGYYHEAERLYHDAWKISSRELGDEHRNTLSLANNLALLYQLLGRYEEAERLCLKTVQISISSFGYEAPKILIYRSNLAMLYYHQERYEEAERLCNEVLKMKKRVFGEKNHSTLLSMGHLARIYHKLERYEEAESLFRETLEIWKQVRGDNHPDILISMNDFGRLYVALHRYDEAKKLLEGALKTGRQFLDEDHPTILQSKDNLGALYKEQGDYDKAESLLLEAVKGRILKLGEKHPKTRESVDKLVDVYEAWGKPEKVEKWRAKLPQTKAVDE